MFGDGEPYLSAPKPEVRRILDELTVPKAWDHDRFKRVLIALAITGNGQSVPAPNRPDSIHLQGLLGNAVNTLQSRTRDTGLEHAQPVFTDSDSLQLVTGKTTRGTNQEVRVSSDRQPGRERFQRLCGTLHTHPVETAQMTAHGLSGQDYRTLLGDSSQQFALMAWGENNRMLILKTSVTPNNLKTEQIEARIKALEQEFLQKSFQSPIQRVIDFNKTVCVEFGLTMYLANMTSRNLFNRINVAQ